MPYDAFISYARNDGSPDAHEVVAILNRYDIAACLDTNDPTEPGLSLRKELERSIKDSRVMVAVLTNQYEDSEWAQFEYETAIGLQKTVIPVIFGSRSSIAWLKKPRWFDSRARSVNFGTRPDDRTRATLELIEATTPARPIIDEAERVAATRGLLDAAAVIDQMLNDLGVTGFPRTDVLSHKARFLRLAGRRREAMETLDRLPPLDPDSPFHVLQQTLVTSAVLRIDVGDYVDARARLAEAAAVLSRKTSWEADDHRRRLLLAEVTREIARSYLEETYNVHDARMSCFELEVAWSVYMEALALVRQDDDILGHAWVHENLGILAKLYAERSAELERRPANAPVTNLDYPAIARFCGSVDNLTEQSFNHFNVALKLFQRCRDRMKRNEGEAWTRYHRAQARIFRSHYSTEALREAVAELNEVAALFEGIAEGQGLTYAELFDISRRLGGNGSAVAYGTRAIELLRASEKHSGVVQRIERQLGAEEVRDEP